MANILLNIFSPIILPYIPAFPQADGALFELPQTPPCLRNFFYFLYKKYRVGNMDLCKLV